MTASTQRLQVAEIEPAVWCYSDWDDVIDVVSCPDPVLFQAMQAEMSVTSECLQADSFPLMVISAAGS